MVDEAFTVSNDVLLVLPGHRLLLALLLELVVLQEDSLSMI